jgi:2-polyprenyl-3-methyl-5-hydroxy-6-metoxy-1,4-benzoquinol methylase
MDLSALSKDDQRKLFAFQVFSKLEGAVTAGMIHLGDSLGLYRAMSQTSDWMTSAEVADRAGLQERWVREWLHNQAAARIIEWRQQEDGVSFRLSEPAVDVLANDASEHFGMGMFHRLPQTMDALRDMPRAFRTGVGCNYDSHGPEGAVGIERSFEPWSRVNLLTKVVPALQGLESRLHDGIRVVDIGCGAGSALLILAEAFPRSSFTGYDISRFALERANEKLLSSGLTNVSFHHPDEHAMPARGTVDFVTTFDCIHDMTSPQEMINDIYEMLTESGRWLLVDIKAQETFEENVMGNPMCSLMYGISVLSCMSSALSEPHGAGLGTLGLPESLARAMALEAGFTAFARLEVDHSVNAFYEVLK